MKKRAGWSILPAITSARSAVLVIFTFGLQITLICVISDTEVALEETTVTVLTMYPQVCELLTALTRTLALCPA